MALLVSCLDEGLLLVEGDRIERIDGVPSAGLAVGRFGGARAVHDPAETTRVGEILLERGRRLSVAGLLDAHELAGRSASRLRLDARERRPLGRRERPGRPPLAGAR